MQKLYYIVISAEIVCDMFHYIISEWSKSFISKTYYIIYMGIYTYIIEIKYYISYMLENISNIIYILHMLQPPIICHPSTLYPNFLFTISVKAK